MVYIYTQTEQNMKDNGKMTNKMEKEKKYGQMELHMKEIMQMGKSKVMVYLDGQINQYIKANFSIIIYMEREYTLLLMEENMMEIG